MGLGSLFGGHKKQAAAAVEMPPCSHAVLVARWENVQDMGHEDKASHYMCESCHQEFTPAQAEEIRGSLAEKLATITEASPDPEASNS